VSRQAWQREDRDGGGRLRAGQTGMPMVAMATAGRAWGARAVSLQGGAGVRVCAGCVRLLGVKGGGWLRSERERGLAEGVVCLGLLLSLDAN
jgi:hypothetical protein